MIQNHLLQLMCMVAMEPPVNFGANEVRNKKVDVLNAVRPIEPAELYKSAARGRYGQLFQGQPVPGYREEPGVSPDSSTETFAALKLYVDNWRWQDVPFLPYAPAKRMPTKFSHISIQFKRCRTSFFPPVVAEHFELQSSLSINIQPKERNRPTIIQARFRRVWGSNSRLFSMDFYYGEQFKKQPPEAYETLLYDNDKQGTGRCLCGTIRNKRHGQWSRRYSRHGPRRRAPIFRTARPSSLGQWRRRKRS